jgi:DNA-binding IclR family transcriptional regulator
MKQVEKEILDYIEKNDGVFFGGIAQRLRLPNKEILQHLLDLKSKGLIYKDKDGGRFKIQQRG